MMDEADEASQDLPVPSAGMTTMYRDGVLIMGAALCPIRLRNWRMAMIDVHLILEGDSARMHFSSDETKTKRELEFELPAEYVPLLRRYIDQYRPHLLQPDAADQGFLWPSSRGGMVHRNTLSRAIKDALVKRTGKRFTFHMFRHAAATFIADVAPERVGLAAGVLQHRRLSTTRRHYIRSRMRQAARGYQDAVKAVVRKARRRKAGQKKDD